MKQMLIVTDLSFPYGSAMASRILSFCHLFNDLGYKVHAITSKLEGSNYAYNQTYDNGYYSYEVVDSIRNYGLQTLLGNENLPHKVDLYLKHNDVDFVFMTSLNMNFSRVFKVCKNNNKKVILEQCEWYDPSSFKFGKYDPRFLNFFKNVKYEYKKVDAVISISNLLNEYYLSLNKKSIRIPSILDVSNKPFSSKTNNEKINLVYTGNASKSKELLKPILEALSSQKAYLDNFVFHIYGLNDVQLANNISNNDLFEKTKRNVACHGFVSQELIDEILMKSDYQIFIRPYRRSSDAGFPTKLAESLAVGTPVIANVTGDIGLYLEDGNNGFLCKGSTCKDVCAVFDKVLKISKTEYSELRKNARKTAELNFDYKMYIEDVRKLIEEL